MNSSLENAIRFVSQELLANPSADFVKLAEEASRKFDLTPIESERLIQIHLSGKEKS